MRMKGVKDGIEGLADIILNIADIMHGRAASSILLGNCIEVPDKLESTLGVLLAYNDLLGCLFEVADELWSDVGLEDSEYKVKSLFWFLASRGMLRNFMAFACRVLLEHELCSLERCFEAFHCILSNRSVNCKPFAVSANIFSQALHTYF